jgi:hypothetical protein
MTVEKVDPRMQAAIDELEQMVLARYPSTTFEVGGDPEGGDAVFVRAVVDVDDPDEVTAIVIDRMVDLLVDEGLPVYIVAVRSPIHEAAERQRQQRNMARFA